MTEWGLLAVQLARIYLDFAEATKDMTSDQAAAKWAQTQARAKRAEDLWSAAGGG